MAQLAGEPHRDGSQERISSHCSQEVDSADRSCCCAQPRRWNNSLETGPSARGAEVLLSGRGPRPEEWHATCLGQPWMKLTMPL